MRMPVGRGVARADDANRALGQHEFGVAQDREQRGRVGQQGQQGGVVGVAEEEEAGAQAVQGGEFTLGVGDRVDV